MRAACTHSPAEHSTKMYGQLKRQHTLRVVYELGLARDSRTTSCVRACFGQIILASARSYASVEGNIMGLMIPGVPNHFEESFDPESSRAAAS